MAESDLSLFKVMAAALGLTCCNHTQPADGAASEVSSGQHHMQSLPSAGRCKSSGPGQEQRPRQGSMKAPSSRLMASRRTWTGSVPPSSACSSSLTRPSVLTHYGRARCDAMHVVPSHVMANQHASCMWRWHALSMLPVHHSMLPLACC